MTFRAPHSEFQVTPYLLPEILVPNLSIGIVTVGPNLAVYGSVDAVLVVAGHLESEVNIAKWETQQTYPQESGYMPTSLDDPDRDGTQTLGKPTFDWSVAAAGQVEIHLKPTITFGIVFDARWKAPKAAVDLVADGYIILHAAAAAGSGATCPFTYGIDAGADLYAQLTAPILFNWGGTSRVPFASIQPRQITPGGTCPAQETTKRRDLSFIDSLAHTNNSRLESFETRSEQGHIREIVAADKALSGTSHTDPGLSAFSHEASKRDNTVIGPIIRIPQKYLKCPGNGEETGDAPGPACELCYTIDEVDPNPSGSKLKRDDTDSTCPYIPPTADDLCTDLANAKRALTSTKTYTLSWHPGFMFYAAPYPRCSASDTGGLPSKWYLPLNDRTQACSPKVVKSSMSGKRVDGIAITNFATDHVFEIHLFSGFLEWLVGNGKVYSAGGSSIPFPSGWAAASTTWADQVLGGELP